jgi:hypothetical protein
MMQGMIGADDSDCKRREPQQRDDQKRGKCGQICGGRRSQPVSSPTISINLQLIERRRLFLDCGFFPPPVASRPHQCSAQKLEKSEAFLLLPGENAVRQLRSICVFTAIICSGGELVSAIAGNARFYRLNLTQCSDTYFQ